MKQYPQVFRRIQPHNTTVTGFNEDHPMSGRQDCADGILFISTYYTKCINNMLQRKSTKKHTTMTCCFLQRKISNKRQKLIPKDLIRIFQISRCAGIKVFFRPSISPKLVPRRHAIFFSADESGTNRPSGKTFLQGVIWRRKWHCTKHSMAVYLRKAFFYSY